MGVLVVGMHRSGTSALAGALSDLGLVVGPEDQRLHGDLANPRGYFELQAVADLNDEVLEYLGGTWDRPPAAPPGWASDPGLDPFIARAKQLVTALSPDGTYVLKDPRTALLLPLWRRALQDRCAAVMVVRNPAEVAWSLALRDGTPVGTSYALWGAYNRSAIEGLTGLPVSVCFYDDLVDRPGEVLGEIAHSLRDWGQLHGDVNIDLAASRIEPSLRRDTWPRNRMELASPPDELAELFKLLGEQVGSHPVYNPSMPSGPSWWEQTLLEERRMSGVVLRQAAQNLVALRAEYDMTQRRLQEAQTAFQAAEERVARLTADRSRGLKELSAEKGRQQVVVARLRHKMARLRDRDLQRIRRARRLPVRLYRWVSRRGTGQSAPGER